MLKNLYEVGVWVKAKTIKPNFTSEEVLAKVPKQYKEKYTKYFLHQKAHFLIMINFLIT